MQTSVTWDGNNSNLIPMAGNGITCVEPSGYRTKEMVIYFIS